MSASRLGIAAVVVVALSASGIEASTRLRITTQLPPTNLIAENLYRFEALVEKASDGEIEIEIFDSAQLYKDKEVPQAVASGAIDMGSVPLTRFVGTTPIVDLFFVPFVCEDLDAVFAATQPDHVIRTTIEAEVLKTGVRQAFADETASVIADFIEESGPVGHDLVEEARKLQ